MSKYLNSFSTSFLIFNSIKVNVEKDIRIKKEVRIIGIDDGHFTKKQKKVIVVGAITRGKKSLDGLLSTKITVDGLDATNKISSMINNSSHRHQLRFIMLSGITFGGFNLVDIRQLYKNTGIPVVVFIRRRPDLDSIRNALRKNFPDWKKRWEIIEKAGKIYSVRVNERSKIYIQKSGLGINLAKQLVKKTIAYGNTPEPLRVAHIIATGITRGDSRGGV